MSQPSPPNKKRKREKVNREEESTKAFCQSIFSDLLHLEPKQQMTCKIDIMCLIQKYRMGGDSIIKEPFRSEAAEAIGNEQSDDVVLIKNQPKIKKEPVEKEKHKPQSEPAMDEESVSDVPVNISTLKSQISTGGVYQNYCDWCHMRANKLHVKSAAHQAAACAYYTRYSLLQLDPSTFKFTENPIGLQCILCFDRTLNSWWEVRDHMSSYERTHKTYISNESAVYFELVQKMSQGTLKFKNFAFCLMCNKHISSKDHDGQTHQQNLKNIKAFCLLKNEVYCFSCKLIFNIEKLDEHKKDPVHQTNLDIYHVRNKKANKIKYKQIYRWYHQ